MNRCQATQKQVRTGWNNAHWICSAKILQTCSSGRQLPMLSNTAMVVVYCKNIHYANSWGCSHYFIGTQNHALMVQFWFRGCFESHQVGIDDLKAIEAAASFSCHLVQTILNKSFECIVPYFQSYGLTLWQSIKSLNYEMSCLSLYQIANESTSLIASYLII